MQKGNILILIIVIFVIVAATIFYTTQQKPTNIPQAPQIKTQQTNNWKEETLNGFYSGTYKFKYPPELELERPERLHPKDKSKGSYVINFYPQITGWGYGDFDAWSEDRQKITLGKKGYEQIKGYHNGKMYQVSFIPEWTGGFVSVTVTWDEKYDRYDEAIQTTYKVLETLEEVR